MASISTRGSPSRWLFAAALLTFGLQSPDAAAEPRFAISPDGAEVTDNQTGLIWRRCTEGQTFASGNCTGTALGLSHEAALVHARSQAGWRLPNIKELASIVDRSRLSPSIDVAAFPSTVSWWYWSSSPQVGNSGNAGNAWSVYFDNGEVSNLTYRNFSGNVRLVR